MKVAGAVEVLDEGWAPVMGVEMRIRNQLASRKWRHIPQDGELINIRSQPLSIIHCPPFRLTIDLGAVDEEVQGAVLVSGALGSSPSSTRDPQVATIDRHPILRPAVFSYFCMYP